MKRKHLFWIVPVVLLVSFLTWNYWPMSPVKLIVSPETTVITSPLLPDGTPDYPAGINAMLSAGVTPENNAVVGLLKILGTEHIPYEHFGAVLAGLGVEADDLPVASMFETDDAYCKRLGITSNEDYEWYDYPDGIMDGAWTAQDHPDLAAWLASNAEALDAFVAESNRSTYFEPVVSVEQFDRMQIIKLGNLMKVARALSARSRGRTGDGDIPGAIDDAVALHRVARMCRGTLLMYLVAEGMEGSAIKAERVIVQSSTATREDLAMLQRELAALPERTSLADAMETDRLQSLAIMIMWCEDGESIQNWPFKTPIDYGRLDVNIVMRYYNRAMDDHLRAFRGKTHQEMTEVLVALSYERAPRGFEEFNAWRKEADQRPTYAKWGRLGRTAYSRMVIERYVAYVFPGIEKIAGKEATVTAQTRAMATLIAARLYEMDNGEYPADMAALVAGGYLEAQPVDPFDGAPLRYLLTAEEVVVYSVGVNGTDDDGHGSDRATCIRCGWDCDDSGDDVAIVLKR